MRLRAWLVGASRTSADETTAQATMMRALGRMALSRTEPVRVRSGMCFCPPRMWLSRGAIDDHSRRKPGLHSVFYLPTVAVCRTGDPCVRRAGGTVAPERRSRSRPLITLVARLGVLQALDV